MESDGGIGLHFELSEHGSYLFTVSDGWFGLWRRDSALRKWTALIDWTSSPAIHAGSQTNHLEVVRSSDRIILSINGQIIGAVTDGTHHANLLGIWREAYSPNFDGRFDNFEVYANTCTNASATAAGRNMKSIESGDQNSGQPSASVIREIAVELMSGRNRTLPGCQPAPTR